MSKARRLVHHPHRLTTLSFVLAGAVTAVGACSSGEVSVDEQVALSGQGLNWTGGCACLPVSACPTVTAGCVRAPTGLDGCSTILDPCARTGDTYCYIVPDARTCTNSELGKTGTCDGGYCGRCPGCYTKTGLCMPGTNLTACGTGAVACDNCNDGNDCTKDVCSTGGCLHSVLGNGNTCTGGVCYAGNCCKGCVLNNTCQAGVVLDACGAAGGECKTCDKPSNPCLRATCTAGACGTEPVPLGTACSDGDVCNGEEACDGNGTCTPGTKKDCTSNDPCIDSKCDSKQGCVVSINAGAQCNDGNACTVGDLCDAAGKCVSGTPKSCVDGKYCTQDDCDPTTGNCLNPPLPDNTPCDDGIACTTGETCQNGFCKVAGAATCDDGKFCTKDTVDCVTGKCLSDSGPMQGAACIPTDKCSYNGTCTGETCVGGTAVNCDDGNPCTKDACDPASGCTHTNEPATTLCVDGNPCTTDDRCRPLSGKCAGTPIVCAALDDCHAAGSCDAVTGRCDDPRRADGFPCANRTGTCASGVCEISAAGGAAGAAGAAGTAGDWGIDGTAGGGVLATNGGAAGAPDAAGGDATAGGTSGGKGSGTGGSSVDEGDVYKRNPGGCNCSVPGRSSHLRLALLGLLGLALGLGRKRR